MDAQGTIGIKATLDISEMQRNVQRYVQNINMIGVPERESTEFR